LWSTTTISNEASNKTNKGKKSLLRRHNDGDSHDLRLWWSGHGVVQAATAAVLAADLHLAMLLSNSEISR